MNNRFRHVRGPLIAVIALAMSAGVAFAAHPAADRGPSNVSQGNPSETADPGESEAPEASEGADNSNDSAGTNCTTDPTTLTADQLAAMSHGSIVCWAAQQATPEGWDNHGAWVSHWAKMNRGADASAAGKAKGHSNQP